MKILFISRKFPPSVGGMELFARDISQALSEQAEVVLVKWGGSRKWYPIALPYLAILAFYKLMRGDIDLIHVQDSLLSPLGLVLSRIFNKPFSVVSHGLDLTWGNSLYQKIIPYSIKRASALYAISQEVHRVLASKGVDPEKIYTIALAVNDNIYGQYSHAEGREILEIDDNRKVLLSVGRLVARKGIKNFVRDVLPALVKKHKDVLFIVIGEGKDRKNIEAEIEKQNLRKNVVLMGQVEDYKQLAAYNAADVFVMPNIAVKEDIEGFGLVVLEASLSKLPVVAYGIDGIKDALVNNKNGILIEPGDKEKFIRAVDELLASSDKAKQFGASSRTYTLENYSWDKVAKKYLEVYKRILKS